MAHYISQVCFIYHTLFCFVIAWFCMVTTGVLRDANISTGANPTIAALTAKQP